MHRKYKLALLGDTCSGKTSILKKIQGEKWNSNICMTIGIDIIYKRETVKDQIYEFEIYDTSGVPRFNDIVQQFLKQSQPSIDGVIICIDINNPDYFSQIMNWKSMLVECLLDVPILIAANKADLNNSKIKNIQFQDFEIIETSAKNGQNIEQLLQSMLKLLRVRKSSIRNYKEISWKEETSYWGWFCCKI